MLDVASPVMRCQTQGQRPERDATITTHLLLDTEILRKLGANLSLEPFTVVWQVFAFYLAVEWRHEPACLLVAANLFVLVSSCRRRAAL